jgi:hypothetical protein
MPKKAPNDSRPLTSSILNQAEMRASSGTNQYKRDRSSSNNGKRPPIPAEKDTQYFNHQVQPSLSHTIDQYREDMGPHTNSSIIAEMHY